MFLAVFDELFLVVLPHNKHFCSIHLILFDLRSILQVQLLISFDFLFDFIPLPVCLFGELVDSYDILLLIFDLPPQLLCVPIGLSKG
jgi:hypothetical protein